MGWTGSNDLSSGLNGYTTSNPYTCSDRDHILDDDFSVSEGTVYRVFVTAKKVSGDLEMQGGIWYTEQTSGDSWDGYKGTFAKIDTLSDGWGRYYKDITVPSGKTKGKFYIQLDQDHGGGSTTWNIADMSVVESSQATSVTIPQGSIGDKVYTANWIQGI